MRNHLSRHSLPGRGVGRLLLIALWLTLTATGAAAPTEDYTYTYKGVKYTYLTEHNYTQFFNTSVHTPQDYGWYTDADGWFVNAEKDNITMAEADPNGIPESGEVVIVGDLVGLFTGHTHLGGIADSGFKGEQQLRRVSFQDCDAMSYTARSGFYFFIGDKAFANCPQLTEVNMMEWKTSGTNHWEAMQPTYVKRLWGSMLDDSPQAWIRVGTSVYQDYLGSQTWTEVRDRITTYEHSSADISVEGITYSFLKAEDGSALSNADDQHEQIMKTLRLWNADYQQFNAASLLSDKSRTKDEANLWYTTVKGCDADYLKNHNGTARIYNDPGSYYNYKTIAIRKGAFQNCDDLQVVEFAQTNGRSENSYSDPKMVIENGAFKGCRNLKELRLYLWAQEGDDHWEILGPENVIPGDNIFGLPTSEEITAAAEQQKELSPIVNPDLRIVVSPMRYNDFITDPNWMPYAAYIVAADYEPTTWDAETVDGLIYDYESKTANVASTDQVVTQEMSWWNVPIKIYEIITIYQTISSMASTWSGAFASDAAKASIGESVFQEAELYIGPGQDMAKASMSIKPLAEGVLNGNPADIASIAGKGVKEYLEREYFAAGVKAGIITAGDPPYFVSNLAEKISTTSWLRTWLGQSLMTTYHNWMARAAQSALPGYAMLRQFYLNAIANTLEAGTTGAAALVAEQTAMQGAFAAYRTLSDCVNQDQYVEALKNQILSNIHNVSYNNTMIYTPDKKLIYHVYVKKPAEQREHFTIYHDIGRVYNYRTVAIHPDAFRGNTTLQRIDFAESYSSGADSYVPMMLAIPDSAFAGCTSLERFELMYTTREGGVRGLGPENFVLCGDSIFAGCDSTKLKIIIPEDRKQDFLDNESWKKYQRYFVYEQVEDKVEFTEFGVKYGYSYKNNTTKSEERIGGHTIEHLYAIGPDDEYIKKNNGAMGLFNDIGSFNNYKLDYAKKNAFRGNQNVKSVSFWDVAGWLWTGDAYTDLQMTLQDSCFADCPNLQYVDMLYLRTDGSNVAEPLTPRMVQLGKGVFSGSPDVRLKMTERQLDWFRADSAWCKWQDRFFPALFLPADPVVVSKLSSLKYQNDVARPWYDNNASKWGDWLDASLLTSKDFFNGKFSGNTELRSFPDFKRFELAGLDYVGGSWFAGCTNLSAIELPSTINTIQGYAFQQCSSLTEITIPAAVTLIQEYAFSSTGLKTVRCLGTTPAKLEKVVFDTSHLEKIYVPAKAVEAYKTAWPDYAKYIVSDADYKVLRKVDVRTPGSLAEQLGLTLVMDGDRLRTVSGPYQKYDSLVVTGKLNGLDVGVLRHLMGADAWDSDPTDGRLRYLNLYYATLLKDTKYSYNLWGVDEYLEKDNWVGEYMFHNCTALETLILPASVTEIGENTFQDATNLKRIFVGDKTAKYTRDLLQNLKGIDELVLYTDQFATSESSDPWEAPIGSVTVKHSQLGQYSHDPALIERAYDISGPFEDDAVLTCLVQRGLYFPSQWSGLTSTKTPDPDAAYEKGNGYIFYRDQNLRTFDEFRQFTGITRLDYDFQNCSALERISLPDSLKYIGVEAFMGCQSLKSITIAADSVPELERDAFKDLPADFRVYVPKTHVKRYREKWAQYADHIEGEEESYRNDIIEVTLTEPNTLAEKLGMKIVFVREIDGELNAPIISGDSYSHIRALKINGPISIMDFILLRFLGGYNLSTLTRNYFARMEYLDLYDANIVKTEDINFTDGNGKFIDFSEDDLLPLFALEKAYNLKTLILPRTCKTVERRALQECEYLETLVVGDDCEEFNWNALDDCASLTRMYILAKKKMEMDQENWAWRNLCNNYSPTFDAFYVRPSLYQEYIADPAYVGSTQRTNNISVGAFSDDESFAAFGSHAAATHDDLIQVGDVKGWFASHPDIPDLTALQYTQVDSLHAADIQPLTQLKRITLPASIKHVDGETFKNAAGLRYVDMSQCADYAPTLAAEGGVRTLGIGEQTLAYVPAGSVPSGSAAGVNVAVATGRGFHAETFRLYDGEDYCVPFAVDADQVENTRTLAKSSVPYTVCLPYTLDIPAGAKAYRLSGRSTGELIFAEHIGRLEAMQPYLIWTEQSDAQLSAVGVTLPASTNPSTIGKQQQTVGYTLRGTLTGISNQEAVELGAYVMNDDAKWHPVLSDTDDHRAAAVPPFRAYLLQSRQGTRAAIGMTLEDATGIEQLRTVDADGTERVYDLSGRRIDTNAKGIVIRNGKKQIIK